MVAFPEKPKISDFNDFVEATHPKYANVCSEMSWVEQEIILNAQNATFNLGGKWFASLVETKKELYDAFEKGET